MYRFKNWCIETVQKAVSGLVNTEEKHEALAVKITQSVDAYETAKNGNIGATPSTQNYLCKVCKSPCVYCVSLQGSSVDKRRNSNSDAMSNNTRILDYKETAEVSTQTEPLTPILELTNLQKSTNDLPDLLVSSTLSGDPLKVVTCPPPPPPPPPPPLPQKLMTTSLTNTTRKKQTVLKKSQSVGMSIGPEITVELLKNVKLRKLGDEKDVSQLHRDNLLKDRITCAQPAVTLELLQKVTLRKTQTIKMGDFESSTTKAENIGIAYNGSPGGSPKLLKRKRQPLKEQHSVPCKQRQQSTAKRE